MVEDHGEARVRANLQDEKSKLTQAANRLEQLVRELGIIPDVDEAAPFQDPDDDDEPIRRPGRRYSPPRAETESPDTSLVDRHN